MREVGRLWAVECRRLATSRRWLLAAATMLVASYLAAADVATESRVSRLAPAALDVHAALTNNLMYVGYLAFVGFAFVTGGVASSDCASGHAALVLSRGVRRSDWWLAKVGAVGAMALLAQFVLVGCCLLMGRVWHGWGLEARASPLATATLQAHAMMLFPGRDLGSSALGRQLTVAAYEALAFWALALVLVVVSLRWPRTPPAGVALLALMGDYVLVKAWDPWATVSFGARLLEGSAADPFGSLVTSAIVLVAVGSIAVAVGRVLASRIEL